MGDLRGFDAVVKMCYNVIAMFGHKQETPSEKGKVVPRPDNPLIGVDALWKRVRMNGLMLQELEQRVEILERARKRDAVQASRTKYAAMVDDKGGNGQDLYMNAYRALGGK